ncbi:hypothetical protein DEIPH_ctg050orf0032 [Deinococcus phoenicis]|uniref:Uncharacterized protein n=2 Tax=Deinococcus phoenicis TaxID=1476583 RepID=A0A016QMS2_9DEIO|nr:hypothetical protein DEIPH_ctg050orf0032 [Deinococcus phoenicis]
MAAALGSGGALAASYTVKSGDTLYKVALAHNLEPAELMRLNSLNSSTLEVGQKLNVGAAAAAQAPAARPAAPQAARPAAQPARPAAQPAARPVTRPAAPAARPAQAAAPSRGGAFVRTAATRYLGIRYALGGTGGGGIDCSGFTMRVFQQMGINLPRTASGQWRVGHAVNSRNLQAGDLVFFNTTGRGASHVGVYVGSGMMANANSYQGRTVIEPLFSNPYWASRYIGARRVLS